MKKLFEYVEEGDAKNILKMLNNGADVNQTDKLGGWTALMYAVTFYEDIVYGADTVHGKDLVEMLIKNGADVNRVNSAGVTALMIASEHYLIDIVQLLLDNDADVNLIDKSGDSALIIAVYNGHTEIVQLLLEAGADVFQVDKRGDTVLDIAEEEDQEMVDLLTHHIKDELVPTIAPMYVAYMKEIVAKQIETQKDAHKLKSYIKLRNEIDKIKFKQVKELIEYQFTDEDLFAGIELLKTYETS